MQKMQSNDLLKSRFFTSGAGYSETVIKLKNENFWNFAGWKLDIWLENPR